MNFEYKKLNIPNCSFNISPSGIAKFFDYPTIWYKENFTDEVQFKGNTATVLGTIIHSIAEEYARNPDERINTVEIDKYLGNYTLNMDVNVVEIKRLYPMMAQALINNYISKNITTDIENSVYRNIYKDIYVGGTYDAVLVDTVIDYKNVAKKPNTEKIPFAYKIQLLAYAFILSAQGYHINRIRVVYTVRPTKTLGVRIFVVNETITTEDWLLINNTLDLIAKTVTKHKEDNSLIPLLYKSMKL